MKEEIKVLTTAVEDNLVKLNDGQVGIIMGGGGLDVDVKIAEVTAQGYDCVKDESGAFVRIKERSKNPTAGKGK